MQELTPASKLRESMHSHRMSDSITSKRCGEIITYYMTTGRLRQEWNVYSAHWQPMQPRPFCCGDSDIIYGEDSPNQSLHDIDTITCECVGNILPAWRTTEAWEIVWQSLELNFAINLHTLCGCGTWVASITNSDLFSRRRAPTLKPLNICKAIQHLTKKS